MIWNGGMVVIYYLLLLLLIMIKCWDIFWIHFFLDWWLIDTVHQSSEGINNKAQKTAVRFEKNTKWDDFWSWRCVHYGTCSGFYVGFIAECLFWPYNIQNKYHAFPTTCIFLIFFIIFLLISLSLSNTIALNFKRKIYSHFLYHDLQSQFLVDWSLFISNKCMWTCIWTSRKSLLGVHFHQNRSLAHKK